MGDRLEEPEIKDLHGDQIPLDLAFNLNVQAPLSV
jgi:hypothetical protein